MLIIFLMFYPDQYTLGGVPIGFYGSTLGVGFRRNVDNQYWSIGMDCPNTALGGTNGIQLRNGDDPRLVAELVNVSSKDTDTIRVGPETCTVSRADPWGSINYCICWTPRGPHLVFSPPA